METQESSSLVELGRATREASRVLADLAPDLRAQAIEHMALALEEAATEIVAANREDLAAAEAEGLSSALYARLKLDEAKLRSEIAGCAVWAGCPTQWDRDNSAASWTQTSY